MKEKEFKEALELTINGEKYKWHEEYILGIEIKDLGQIPVEAELFLEVQKPWEDELIHNDTRVNLARPGIEVFVTKERHPETIILTILTTKGNWTNAVFSKKLTINQLIQRVIAKFKFEADGSYALKVTGTPSFLPGDVTLESLQLPDCSSLTFSDLGKGAVA